MKSFLMVLLLVLSVTTASFAQQEEVRGHFAQQEVWRYQHGLYVPVNDKDLTPEQYAKLTINVLSETLKLTEEQKQKTYQIVYQHRKTNDSLLKNGVHLNDAQLWSLYNSVDKQLKEILTDSQYTRYETAELSF